MNILGIDTILHDTCVAVLGDGKVLSNIISHKMLPESRKNLLNFTFQHQKKIGKLIRNALFEAKLCLKDISLIAVSNKGSLLSSILVGVVTANVLATLQDIPVIGIKHQEAHLFSNWIERNRDDFSFPILVFSASGGHSSMFVLEDKKLNFKKIYLKNGVKNIDDRNPIFIGLGTIADDVIFRLKLNKSNERKNDDGFFISNLAIKGDSSKYDFLKGCTFFSDKFLDFEKIRDYVLSCLDKVICNRKIIPKKLIYDLAASYERFIAEIISENIIYWAKKNAVNEIHLTGGLSANNELRKIVDKKVKKLGVKFKYPKKIEYCIDNAAMVANLGYMMYSKNKTGKKYVEIESDLVLEKIAVSQHF